MTGGEGEGKPNDVYNRRDEYNTAATIPSSVVARARDVDYVRIE